MLASDLAQHQRPRLGPLKKVPDSLQLGIESQSEGEFCMEWRMHHWRRTKDVIHIEDSPKLWHNDQLRKIEITNDWYVHLGIVYVPRFPGRINPNQVVGCWAATTSKSTPCDSGPATTDYTLQSRWLLKTTTLQHFSSCFILTVLPNKLLD